MLLIKKKKSNLHITFIAQNNLNLFSIYFFRSTPFFFFLVKSRLGLYTVSIAQGQNKTREKTNRKKRQEKKGVLLSLQARKGGKRRGPLGGVATLWRNRAFMISQTKPWATSGLWLFLPPFMQKQDYTKAASCCSGGWNHLCHPLPICRPPLPVHTYSPFTVLLLPNIIQHK